MSKRGRYAKQEEEVVDKDKKKARRAQHMHSNNNLSTNIEDRETGSDNDSDGDASSSSLPSITLDSSSSLTTHPSAKHNKHENANDDDSSTSDDDSMAWASSFVNTVESEALEAPRTTHQHTEEEEEGGEQDEDDEAERQDIEERIENLEAQPRKGGHEWTEEDRVTKSRKSDLPVRDSSGRIVQPGQSEKSVHPREVLRRQWEQLRTSEGTEKQETPEYEEGEQEDRDEEEERKNSEKRMKVKSSKQARIENIIDNFRVGNLSEKEILKRRKDRKLQIANLAQKIIENPENSICSNAPSSMRTQNHDHGKSRRCNRLLDLHEICYDGDIIVRKLALLSELSVVKDILPGYKIKLPQEQEDVKLKKEVKKLREFERDLLIAYERFIDFLESTINAYDNAESLSNSTPLNDEKLEALRKGEWEDLNDDAGSSSSFNELVQRKSHQRRTAKSYLEELQRFHGTKSQIRSLALTALKAACDLLITGYHFNYRERLIALVVSRANHNADKVARPCIGCIKNIFEEDVSCNASILVVKQVRELVKSSDVYVRREIIACLIDLPLKTLQRDSKIQLDEQKKIKTAIAKKAKKEDAQDIMASLKAADAEDRDERVQNQTEALKQSMYIYLRLLRADSNAHLLSPILDGIGKFSTLVDVQLAEDIVLHLKDLVERDSVCESAVDDLLATSVGCELAESYEHVDGPSSSSNKKHADSDKVLSQKKVAKATGGNITLPIDASIKLVETAFRISGGSGKILNSDETVFANYLYRILLRLIAPLPHRMSPAVHTGSYIRAVTAALLKRRDIEVTRVASFIKRCSLVASHLPVHASLALSALVRELLSNYPAAEVTLSSEADKVGSGDYQLDGLEINDTSSNGLSATLWELALLSRHFNPAVRAFSLGTARGFQPALGMGPMKMLQEFDFLGACSFNPSIPTPPSHPEEKKCGPSWKKLFRDVYNDELGNDPDLKNVDPLSDETADSILRGLLAGGDNANNQGQLSSLYHWMGSDENNAYIDAIKQRSFGEYGVPCSTQYLKEWFTSLHHVDMEEQSDGLGIDTEDLHFTE